MNSHHSAATAADVPLLQIDRVGKTYITNRTRTEVLADISFDVRCGDTLAVVGPSGAGKSTLLHILGTLDRPTCGRVLYKGDDLFSWNRGRLAAFRNRKLGFIFQFHHLLPEFSALENTMMPALIAGDERGPTERKAKQLLERMGLEKRFDHKQGELSGGEQQRVAVARALIMGPEMVLADEPTGNLDTQTGHAVFKLLLELNRELQMTLIIVTHNELFSSELPRSVKLVDGRLI